MGINKEKTLRTLFIHYVISLGLILLVILFANYWFINSKVVFYPPNYSEQVIQANYQALQESDQVSQDILSPMSRFGVYNPNGRYLYGNLPAEDSQDYWETYQSGGVSTGLSTYIQAIDRDDQVLLVAYPVTLQFQNDNLRETLPNAELVMTIVVLGEIILLIILWANRLSKQVSQELSTLSEATDRIKDQNLDFEVRASNIREVNEVLWGIDTMRASLKESLESQWLLEKRNQEQIAALAHDIKTPLTIAKGNADLLGETELTEEQMAYRQDIETSTDQMYDYIEKLIAITKTNINQNVKANRTEITVWLEKVKAQSHRLGKTLGIATDWQENIDPGLYVAGALDELERALMNIIQNAFDHSPKGSTITVSSHVSEGRLSIQVKDQGPGFSQKMLTHGKEPFYMASESRTQNNHHGLGLYIASSILNQAKGDLHLANSDQGGGLVSLSLPLV